MSRTIIRYCTWIAPIVLIFGIRMHHNLDENQGEFPQNYTFLLFSLIIMIVNTVLLVVLFFLDTHNSLKNRLLNAYSFLFGTPVIIVLWFCYYYTLSMNLNLEETVYLRDECFMKWRNSYQSENRYHYSSGYCPTANQDSILVTEIYRWGNIKSCGIILDKVYKEIDTSEITFLTENQKKEMLSY